jgi:hypothetical protein
MKPKSMNISGKAEGRATKDGCSFMAALVFKESLEQAGS